ILLSLNGLVPVVKDVEGTIAESQPQKFQPFAVEILRFVHDQVFKWDFAIVREVLQEGTYNVIKGSSCSHDLTGEAVERLVVNIGLRVVGSEVVSEGNIEAEEQDWLSGCCKPPRLLNCQECLPRPGGADHSGVQLLVEEIEHPRLFARQ